ncbi:MAG TPA: hypothetical protein VF297_05075 [Pyrinomonadaceae bacterium]
MNTARYREVTAGYKGNEKLVLSLVVMYQEEGGEAHVDDLARDTGLCSKQILRIAGQLKADGRIVATGGVGRGGYTFALATDNADNLSSLGARASQINEDKSSRQESVNQNKLSPLADPRTNCPDFSNNNEDNLSGTPIAPLSAETTTTNTSQPSVGAGADAPPAAPHSKAKKVRSSKADPRTSHPAIVAVFEVTGRRPDKDLYNKIIRTLGEDPDGQRLVECFEAWRGLGYRPTNYAWITDWYVNGIPEKALNGNGRQHAEPKQSNPRTDTIREYDYSVFDGAESAGVGDFDSQVPPDEWVAAPTAGRPNGDDRRMARSSRH